MAGFLTNVCNYQVFLSFRGQDVRNNFLECFNSYLSCAGIQVFIDRREIEYGERIDTKIVDAIKRSDICIPVLSRNFASSAACLMEVAHMVELEKTILPIFYGVKPSVVRHQWRRYKKSFVKHEERIDTDTIRKWKTALANIAGILGFEFKHVRNGYHEHLRNVVYRLRQLLKTDEQDVTKNLVGIDRDVREMMRKLGVDNQNGQVVDDQSRYVVAVWGLPGIGKSTLAKVVYNKISHLFEGCSFLENVQDEIKQERLVSLQKKLIQDLKKGHHIAVESADVGTKLIKFHFKSKRVLIVLDNVDDFKQIKPLAGELCWFGPGSRIILTTRKKDVIEHYEAKDIKKHEVLSMNENHAIELFCKHAFRSNYPTFFDLHSNITSALGRLPLAIEIVGSYLYGKSYAIWRETLQKLEGETEREVERVLMASYDLLEGNTKEIFLDIACFFIGVEKTIPYYMWDAHERFPNRGVDELQNISFLKIGKENEFWMHDQIRILGREIVKKENLKNPGMRSRLWDYKDVQKTLQNKKFTEKVEALRITPNLNQDEQGFNRVHCDHFHHLSNLRFLELNNVDIEGNPETLLLLNLVWLDWRGCHEKSNLFALNMKNLVILNLCSSQVELNLEDWKQLMQKAGSLKVLNLKDCPWVATSLQFPVSRHLECLILEGCLISSPTIDESISKLENLIYLNMKHCVHFKHLPRGLCSLKKLEELFIDGTEIEILHFEGPLPALKVLSASECKVLGEVTASIGLLKNLHKLILRGCKELEGLPHTIGELVMLQEMDLSDTLINELPPSVKDLKNLKVLKMVHTYLEEFPVAIKDLEKLEELDFTHCESLKGRCDISGLSSLRILRLKCTGIYSIHTRDDGHFNLCILEFEHGVKFIHGLALSL